MTTDRIPNIIDEAIAGLEEALPPVFARNNVGRLLGGAIAPGTLANLGKNGPPYFFIGRNAVYEKSSFLNWLKGQTKMAESAK